MRGENHGRMMIGRMMGGATILPFMVLPFLCGGLPASLSCEGVVCFSASDLIESSILCGGSKWVNG